MSRVPSMNIDYTSRDYEAFRALLIQKLQEKMPEYTDTTETDAGIVIIEALANGLDILSLYADIVANDVLLPTTQSRRLAVLIARCLGYTPYNQTASEYEQVFVLSETQQNDVIIPVGTVVRTEDDNDLNTLYFETVTPLTIPSGKLGNEKDANNNYIYHCTVKAGQSIFQDVLGSSTGAVLQSFKTNYTNVLVDSLEVYVDEGNGDELWTKVDSFIDADANSKVYMVLVDELDQCIIQFGNGLKGKIPVAYPNGITANYRIGGGEVSNVSAGDINTLDTGIAFVESTFNLAISVKGHDKESLESIKVNAPASYRIRDRLVTLDDYEDLLKMTYIDFLDIQAVQDTVDRKLVHLYYIMRDGYSFSAALASEVSQFISARAMIGCTYDIAQYTAQTVNLTCVLYYSSDYDVDEVKANINAYLAGAFSTDNVLFETSLVKSDLEAGVKANVAGVYSFRINTPSTDIITPSASNNILTLGTVTITANAL